MTDADTDRIRQAIEDDASAVLDQASSTPAARRHRGSSLGPPERYLLECWADALRTAFGEVPYLVGSVARAEEWRDVDVRLMLPDDDPILADPSRLVALNVAVSVWGQRATGLPIDFQFQAVGEANAEHDGVRCALIAESLRRTP